MVTFRFVEYGADLGTRQIGVKVRTDLLPLVMGDEKVVLDFTGVDVVTNSFADECIAKLLIEMPLEELKRRTTFRGLNLMASKSVLGALQRRQSVLTGHYKGYQEEDFRVVIWRNKSETDPNVIQIDPNDDPNMIQIVGLIQNNPKISRSELAERLQISERKTRMCIEQLKKEGILIREGSTKRGKWIVIGN